MTIVKLATTGDRILDAPLSQIGDKGLFTKELEHALLDGRIDCAVHSAKDLPTTLPAGCVVGAFTRRRTRAMCSWPGPPRRAPPRPRAPAGLARPPGARVGSSSLRRRSQLLALRPDLALLDLRGNVETRLRKVAQQGLDGTVLAAAGLARLGRAALAAFAFSFEEMLPAVGQGALAVEVRADDERTAALLACLHDGPTALAGARRARPAGRPAGRLPDPHRRPRRAGRRRELALRAFVGSLDGADTLRDSLAGPAADPEALGCALAERLRGAGAERILAAVREASGLVPGSAR